MQLQLLSLRWQMQSQLLLVLMPLQQAFSNKPTQLLITSGNCRHANLRKLPGSLVDAASKERKSKETVRRLGELKCLPKDANIPEHAAKTTADVHSKGTKQSERLHDFFKGLQHLFRDHL